jgi:hypothetical protein
MTAGRQRTSFTPPPPGNDSGRRLQWLADHLPKFQPVRDTLAELYLLRERCLPELPPTDVLRYWDAANGERLSALIGIAKDDDGDVMAAQIVYLDRHGCKVRKETRGFPVVASVRLPSNSGKRGTIIIAEGLETAISIWISTGCEVETWSVGGKEFLKYVEPPAETETVILFADNDDDTEDGGQRSRLTYERTARMLTGRVKRVLIARPDVVGWDANDFFRVLPLEQAIASVRKTIRDAVSSTTGGIANDVHRQHGQ